MISDLFNNRFKFTAFNMPDPPVGDGEDEEEDDEPTDPPSGG